MNYLGITNMQYKILAQWELQNIVNLTNNVKYLYTGSYKIFLREIKQILNEWRDIVFMDWKTEYCYFSTNWCVD